MEKSYDDGDDEYYDEEEEEEAYMWEGEEDDEEPGQDMAASGEISNNVVSAIDGRKMEKVRGTSKWHFSSQRLTAVSFLC